MKNAKMGLTDLARLAQVNLQTVRYYQRTGLIVPHFDEFRNKSFNLEHVNQIKFIKQAQSVGFSLNEIKEILYLKLSKRSNCEPIKKKIHCKATEVELKINQLKNILKVLKSFEHKCDGREISNNCSIINEIGKIKINN